MRCLEGSFMGLGGFEWMAEMRLMLCILDFFRGFSPYVFIGGGGEKLAYRDWRRSLIKTSNFSWTYFCDV